MRSRFVTFSGVAAAGFVFALAGCGTGINDPGPLPQNCIGENPPPSCENTNPPVENVIPAGLTVSNDLLDR